MFSLKPSPPPSALNPARQSLLAHFALDRVYTRGEGVWLSDEQGRRVLDLTSQYGALPFGHNPSEIWEAVLDLQRRAVPTFTQPSRSRMAEALADRLAALVPLAAPSDERAVLFAQSGSEVVEIAIRAARLATGRALIASAEGAYHGHTAAASAASDAELRRLDPAHTADFTRVPFGDVDAARALFAERGAALAAFLVEPVQGERGVYAPPHGYLAAIRELCDDHGVMLIFDEVQTGLGRTGHLFAAQGAGVTPDAIVLAKALGGGVAALAAWIGPQRALDERFARSHGSTFANNSLAIAAGLATLDRLCADDQAILRQVNALSEQARQRLDAIAAAWPGARMSVRQAGLLLAIEFEAPGSDRSFFLQHAAWERSLSAILTAWLLHAQDTRVIPCTRAFHGTVRVLPPLTTTAEELTRGLDAIEQLAATLARDDLASLVRPLIHGDGARARAASPEAAPPPRTPVRASAMPADSNPTGTFAFLIHHTCPEDVVHTNPAFAALDHDELQRLYAWSAARRSHAPVCAMPAIASPTGAWARGWLIGLTHTPESMLLNPREHSVADIQAAVATGRQLGAEVVGLGAYTSIITRNGADALDHRGAITTGNALTVALAIDGLRIAMHATEALHDDAHGLVVGLGAVGRAAAVLATDFISSLTLAGNPLKPHLEAQKVRALHATILRRALDRLQRGHAEGVAGVLARAGLRVEPLLALEDDALIQTVQAAVLARGLPLPVQHTHLATAALPHADAVIAATSHAGPILPAHALRPGAVVCDIAKPPDVAPAVLATRDDVLVFDGALARYPDAIAFGPNLGYPPGVQLACLTETVVLALEGVTQGSFGVGEGPTPEEVATIREAARRHGIHVARLRVNGRDLDDSDLARVARARHLHARLAS